MSLQLGLQPLEHGEGVGRGPGKAADHRSVAQPAHLAGIGLYHRLPQRDLSVARHHHLSVLAHRKNGRAVPACVVAHGISEEAVRRSEEHTSELQSLMRISYAVFCLKKKIKNHNTN